jgi:hypothetical protein
MGKNKSYRNFVLRFVVSQFSIMATSKRKGDIEAQLFQSSSMELNEIKPSTSNPPPSQNNADCIISIHDEYKKIEKDISKRVDYCIVEVHGECKKRNSSQK